MGLLGDIDLGGNTLIVKEVKTGANSAGQVSNVRQTTAAGSTLTVTRQNHLGKTILLDTASGSTVTLPASAGTGDRYQFFVSTTVTSNNHIVKVANASDTMAGMVVAADTAGVSRSEAAGGTDDTITMNGTTTGGILGSWIECIDVATNLWRINANLVGSGTLASSLSATV